MIDSTTAGQHYSSSEGDDDKGKSLSVDDLAAEVHRRFSPKRRVDIPFEVVVQAVQGLDLEEPVQRTESPRLRVHRLVFTGQKRLTGNAPEDFRYDQQFSPGVNVVLVQSNSVGKSSILKTIKFALTGDDSDYDADVRGWIRQVWLQILIDGSKYTVHLDKTGGGLAGYIVQGHVDVSLSGAREIDGVQETMNGAENVEEALRMFFFKRLGLFALSWTQTTTEGTEKRTTSWRTFFQALLIPDSSEDYLLLDKEHAMGNQDGLILSVMLGLKLSQPLNELLVEKQKVNKEEKVNDEERDRVNAEIEELKHALSRAEGELARLSQEQELRLRRYNADPTYRDVLAMRSEQAAKVEEIAQLERERGEIGEQVRHARARARSLREAVALQLHFTGLEVSLCPNCDIDVGEEEVRREQEDHMCRLCGKEAEGATAGEVESMGAEAELFESRAGEGDVLRTKLDRQIQSVRGEAERFRLQAEEARAVLTQGVNYALPTPGEQERRSELDRTIGELRAKVAMTRSSLDRYGSNSQDARRLADAQAKAREVLQEWAKRLNQDILDRLGGLTEEMARRIGAQSVSKITCSALGKLDLRKNDAVVRFGTINNPGERLRVKLAFFLAMMRLGRIRDGGRHPGFLMIDQPGSDEMVDADFESLARVLREIDSDMTDDLQIICFTARPQLGEATRPEKVLGPQAGQYAF